MIERCLDYRRIKKFPEWNIWISSEVFYLMEIENGEDLGVWIVHPSNHRILIHACMGEKCKGRKAVESAKNAFKWVFENTEISKIYAIISNTKRPAQFVASWAGMKYISKDSDNRAYVMVK